MAKFAKIAKKAVIGPFGYPESPIRRGEGVGHFVTSYSPLPY